MKRIPVVLMTLISTTTFSLAQSLAIYTEISPPDQFLAPDGKPAGFAVEVVQEIQKRLGDTTPIKVVPWVRGYTLLQSNPNTMLFSMSRTTDRNPEFEWVGPIKESVFSFFVKADSKIVIKTLGDAKKLSLVGVYKEDVRDQYLTKAGFTNLDRSYDETIMIKKLMAGHIDTFASAAIAIADLAKSAGFKAEDMREAYPFLNVQDYLVFSKGTPGAVITKWSDSLTAMKKDGSFKRIFLKYYPKLPLPGPAVPPP